METWIKEGDNMNYYYKNSERGFLNESTYAIIDKTDKRVPILLKHNFERVTKKEMLHTLSWIKNETQWGTTENNIKVFSKDDKNHFSLEDLFETFE